MKRKIKKRKFLSVLIFLPLACNHSCGLKDKPLKPNIVFILADDWGWGDLSCHGDQQYKTPNLDQLSLEGIDFHCFYVSGSVCSPSRAGILTGHFPSRFGIHNALSLKNNLNAKIGSVDWLDPDAPTIAGFLKEAGYTTAHFGKWHLTGEDGKAVDAPTPDAYGFDEWLTMRGPESWPLSGIRSELTEHAINYIKREHDNPFFLNLWIHETHVPHAPSKQSLALNQELDPRSRVYASVLSDGDREIGRVLKALREAGMEKNTLVIFTSDNGPAAPKEDPNAQLTQYYDLGSTGGFRGNKGTFYEGGVRVPLIVRWPGYIPEGLIDSTTVISAVDLLPTICAAAGLELPGGFQGDGENMLDTWKGNPKQRNTPLFWMQKNQGEWFLATRIDNYKLIMNESQSMIELYDLKKDPSEKYNIASLYPEVVDRLSRLTLSWKASLPPEANPECISIYRNKE